MIIYRITFPNKKYYIGQTSRTLNVRKRENKKMLKKSVFPVYSAIRKFGWDNLRWDEIDFAETLDELDKKEIFWIKKYRSCILFDNSMGYNKTFGGRRGCVFHSDEAKEKISNGVCGEKHANAKLLHHKTPGNRSRESRESDGNKFKEIRQINVHHANCI